MQHKSKRVDYTTLRVRVGPSFITITNTLLTCNIKKIANYYSVMASRYLKTNGPKWTCSRLKNYYTIACRVSLQLDNTKLPFCKSWGSIPCDLRPFEPYLRSPNKNQRRAALTVLRAYTQIYTEPSLDTSTIEDKGPSEIDFESYSAYLDKIAKRFRYKLKPRLNDQPLYTTSKKGPNGPALFSCDKDYHAIKDTVILKTIRELNHEISLRSMPWFKREVQLSNGFAPFFDQIFEVDQVEGLNRTHRKEQLYSTMETFNKWRVRKEPGCYDKCYTSKLGFLPEGGGKTRVVAIGDYFTQDALKPIHSEMYRLLRMLPTDGTSSHNRISQIVKEKTSKGCTVWSFDLTAATDRFPIFIQERVMSWLFGPKIASLWRTLMVDRDFVADGGRLVRYSVGQPMGLLSSWAVFAMTHHIIVEACALKVGITYFKDYVVIGDDVTIFNDPVAKEYMRFLDTMKIQISKAKSLHSSSKTECCAEIAKRLFLNGEELSPVPYDAIESAINDHLLFPNLIRLSMERDVLTSSTKWTPVQDILKRVYNHKRAKDVLILLTSPIQSLPIGITTDIWDDYDSDLITSKFNEIRTEFISSKAQEFYMWKLQESPDMGILGLALESKVDQRLIAKHPLMIVIRSYRDRCRSIYQGIMMSELSKDDLDLIPFLVNPMIPQYIRRTHKVEKVRSQLILKTYKSLVSCK